MEAVPELVQLTWSEGAHVLHLGNDETLFSPAWIQGMNQALDSVSKRPAPLVTVGGHKFYSNGLDLDWFGANPDQGARIAGHMQLLLARVLTLSAPTLALSQALPSEREHCSPWRTTAG